VKLSKHFAICRLLEMGVKISNWWRTWSWLVLPEDKGEEEDEEGKEKEEDEEAAEKRIVKGSFCTLTFNDL
jgi:hypothetical protein